MKKCRNEHSAKTPLGVVPAVAFSVTCFAAFSESTGFAGGIVCSDPVVLHVVVLVSGDETEEVMPSLSSRIMYACTPLSSLGPAEVRAVLVMETKHEPLPTHLVVLEPR